LGLDSLSFRLAATADVSAVVELIESAYRGEESLKGWTSEAGFIDGQRTNSQDISGLIDSPDARFVLAFDADKLVGCALVKNEQGQGYFGMFSVRPARQGAGLGKRLLAEAEKTARSLWGCPTMKMTVISIRDELIAFYERRGYRRTGTEPFPFDKEPGVRRKDFHFVVLTKALD
jgi:GNAT superfamily N-acetyltransferase